MYQFICYKVNRKFEIHYIILGIWDWADYIRFKQ